MSVAPRTEFEVENLLAEAEASPASIIEVRLDSLTSNPASVRRAMDQMRLTKPLVLTVSDEPLIGFGRVKQGHDALRVLADLAQYVDAPAVIDELGATGFFGGARLIRSKHFPRSLTFEEGLSVLEELRRNRCDLVKMVFMAENIRDNLVAMKLASSVNFPNIVFCMGELGLLSRVMAPICGSEWTYASLKKGLETASGQIDVQTLTEIYTALERKQNCEV